MSDVKLYTFAGAAGCYVYEGDYMKVAASLKDQILYRSVERQEWMEYTDKLKAENESLRKDAERYRWIKKESELSSYEDSYSLPIVHAWEYKPGPELNEQFESLDDAIDYVINSSPENPS
jgi:hypothetical protein